jgi:hypothetical protein
MVRPPGSGLRSRPVGVERTLKRKVWQRTPQRLISAASAGSGMGQLACHTEWWLDTSLVLVGVAPDVTLAAFVPSAALVVVGRSWTCTGVLTADVVLALG